MYVFFLSWFPHSFFGPSYSNLCFGVFLLVFLASLFCFHVLKKWGKLMLSREGLQWMAM